MKKTFCAALCLVGILSVRSWSDDDSVSKNRRMVSVQGQGKVHAIPDIARVTAEVRQEGASIDNVSADVRRQMTKVMEALKGQGIEEKDLQTQLYQVQPKYENDKRGNQRPVGFIVTNQVAATVRRIPNLGKILTAVVNAGATGVQGPDFDFDDPHALELKALAAAMENAKAKAATLARSGGAGLGEVWKIDQLNMGGWPGRPRPMMAKGMMAMSAMESEPIAAGEQDFTATVQVSYLLR